MHDRRRTSTDSVRRFRLTRALVGLMALALAAPVVAGPDRAEGYSRPATAAMSALVPRDPAAAPPAGAVVLDAVAAERLAAERAAKPRRGAPAKVGFGRDVAELAGSADTAARLAWRRTAAGGQVAALSITSPGASGLRLGIRVQRLPEDAVLRFHPPGARAVFEIPAREVLGTLRRNREAGAVADLFWSPHVPGPETTLEIELPAGVAADAAAFSVPQLSHLFTSPLAAAAEAVDRIGQSASCEVDATCFAEWAPTANATARMLFVDSGASYVCSGTLLADTVASGTPFFLSANHCIADQATASTLQTFWFYRATLCNSGVLNPGMQTLTGGATLLHASVATDTSFMRLAGTPPGGATFAGWLAAAPAIAAPAIALHYPKGDLQKIAAGAVQDYMDCTQSQSFNCTPTDVASGEFLSVGFTTGVTESGSSGSGLFTTVGASRYLIGQLRGGSSSCSSPNAPDYYGRFDLAYGAALAQWLSPGATPTLSVNREGSGTVSSAPAGIDCGASCTAAFANGTVITLSAVPASGYAFSGWGGACSGAGATCVLTMSGANGVTAVFARVDDSLGASLDNAELAWTTGGSLPFAAQATTWFFGGSAARSGAIGDSQRSSLATTVTGPGTLSWYWRASSEADYDFLSVSLDGVTRASLSGEVAWTPATLNIPAGTHAVRWDYIKDESISGGQDAGWVDRVTLVRPIQPQAGWWWNPAESGRGFFIEVIGDRAFVASYLYAPDGRATWYAAAGAGVYANDRFSAMLDSYSGGQTLTGSWQAPTPQPGSGGSIAIAFSDAQHGTLSWAGGSVPIRRFEFAPGGLSATPAPGQPETGWWWNPNESGRGFSLEVQGNAMFIAGYMYDVAGNPIWYLPEGGMSGATYTGTWAEYGNGQTLTGTYSPPSIVNGAVGPLSIQFSSPATAVLTLPDGRQIPVERFRF